MAFERLKRIFKRQDNPSSSEYGILPYGSFTSWLDGTAENAMRVPAVKACIDAIQGGVSMLPIRLMQADNNGAQRQLNPFTDFRAKTMGHFWGQSLTAREGVRQWMRSALVHGVGYVVVGRARNGTLQSLTPLPRQSVRSVSGGYLYSPGGFGVGASRQGSVFIPRRDMLVLLYQPNIDEDEDNATSPLYRCKNAINLYMAMEQAALNFFANGTPQTAFKLKFDGSQEEQQRAVDNLRASLKEANRTNSPVLVPEIVETIKLGSDPSRGQYTEQRTFQLQQICRVFNVPPAIIHENSKNTYSNAEQAYSIFLTLTLQPWIERMEAEMNLKIFGQQDRYRNRVVFDTREFLRTDVKSELDFNLSAVRDGIMTPNEARARIGLPRSEQDGADVLHAQIQNQPIADQGEPAEQPDMVDNENTTEQEGESNE